MEKKLTPIQELIEWTDNSLVCQKELMNKVTRGVDATHINAEIGVLTSLKVKLQGLLTKDKQVITEAYKTGFLSDDIKLASEYYNENFKK